MGGRKRPACRSVWLGLGTLVVSACGGSTTTQGIVKSGPSLDGSSDDAAFGGADALDEHAVSGSSGGTTNGADASDGSSAMDASDGAARDASDAASATDATDASLACVPAGSCVLSFLSGPDWACSSGTVTATSVTLGPSLGLAVDVCLNSGDPANCPTGAFLYDYPTSGAGSWVGGQTFPQAYWIWRPDVALTATAPSQVAIFRKNFVVGPNATGSLQIAADDFAAVFVNGVAVGSIGSVTDGSLAVTAHSGPTTIDLTSALQPGTNAVVVAAENGPYGCSSTPCTYAQDPAAVVFQGTLRW